MTSKNRKNVSDSPRGRGARNLLGVFLWMSVLLVCIGFFGIDVVTDIVVHGLAATPFNAGELVHLIFEVLAVAGLAYAAITVRAYLQFLHSEAECSRETLHMLRGDFDEVLRRRFQKWGLTTAERDVTLLTVRGLSISDIAAARSTAQGTIKAQLTSIYRKIGVRSKTELMSAIIDEFLEANPNAPPTEPQ